MIHEEGDHMILAKVDKWRAIARQNVAVWPALSPSQRSRLAAALNEPPLNRPGAGQDHGSSA